MAQGQEANRDKLSEIFFHLLHNNVMLGVHIRIASMRRF